MASNQTPNLSLNAWEDDDYVELTEINENFDKIDSKLGTVDTKLGATEAAIANLASGSPRGSYATVTALQAAYPSGTTGTFIVTADGWLYGYISSAWTKIVQYQSTGVADNTISRPKLTTDVQVALPEQWNADGTIYGIVDKDGRAALALDENGVVKIHQLSLGTALDFPDQSISQEKLEGNEYVDEATSGLLWGVVDSQGHLSELVIDENGQVPKWVLDAWKSRTNAAVITCWGDSLTAGSGGSGTTYPGVLASLSGKVTNNMGVGGETSATIVARQGGASMMIDSLTIPATKQKIQVFPVTNTRFTDSMGATGISPLRQGTAGINPCIIGGVEGTLTIQQSSSTSTDVIYFFERTVSSSVDTVINRPTPIITAAMKDKKRDIIVIFIGQNGGWNNDPSYLSMQIRSMVDYSDNKQFIVLGLHTGDSSSRAALEAEMLKQFGRRYINLRDYMSKYGLADAGINPTAQDTIDMAAGKTPTSLMVDGIHFNAAGYTIIGKLVYNRLKELMII